MEENEFEKIKMSVNFENITMSGVLYKRSAVMVLRQHILLSCGDRLTLLPRCRNVQILDRIYHMNGLYFRDDYDSLWR